MLFNEEFFKKLIHLSNWFLILPPTGRNINFFRFYCFLAACSSTIIFFWSSFGRHGLIYTGGSLAPILSILDQVSHTVLHISSLVSSLGATFISQKDYRVFSLKLTKLCSVLNIPWNKFRNLFLIFLAFSIFGLAAVLFDAYVWLTTLGMECYRFYALKSTQTIQCYINTFVMYSYCLTIKNLYKELNSVLRMRMESNRKGTWVFQKFTLRVSYVSKSLIGIHNDLCDLVDSFNNIFGFNLLLVVFNCIVNTLFNAGLCALYALKGSKLNGHEYGTTLLIAQLQWILVYLLLPLMLAAACDSVEKEARKIIPATLIYSNDLPTLPKTYEHRLLKEQLSALCHQAQLRAPQFSAAGFFTVNFTMLGFIIGSVTSYIIVTLQLAEDDQRTKNQVIHVP